MAINDAVNAKFGLFGLLKTLDVIFAGQHHETFQRIAEGLGLALPALPPPPDPAPDGEDEVAGGGADNQVGAGRDAYGRWIDECLNLSNPNATLLLADLFASWTTWTEREKAFTGTANALSRELVRRWGEARKDRANTGIFFKGVKLK
jgi:hypothetical protein